jgi:hypothetical protein
MTDAPGHWLGVARSPGVRTRGTESGAFVSTSKNGFGRPSPRNHQLRSFDPRTANRPNEGGGGAFDGSGPAAERSKIRQSGGPSATSRERPPASWSMKEWITPTIGNRGPAVLPIGVWQQSVYQRKTLLERCRQRTASVPASRVPLAFEKCLFRLLCRARRGGPGNARTPGSLRSSRRSGSRYWAQHRSRRRARSRTGSAAGYPQGSKS